MIKIKMNQLKDSGQCTNTVVAKAGWIPRAKKQKQTEQRCFYG
jgi:hypothetical protein